MAVNKKSTPIEQAISQGKTAEEAEAERRTGGETLSVNGLVSENGDGYQVAKEFVEQRDGKITCTCDDYIGATTLGVDADKGGYRCVHIYAVRHFTTLGDGRASLQEPESVIQEQPVEQPIVGTPADNTADATADMVDAEVDKAYGESGPGKNFIEILSQKLPPQLIRQREAKWSKTGFVEYIEWATVADILDKVAGSNWSFEIKQLLPGANAVTVISRLTVFGVSRDGVGVSGLVGDNWELAIKSSTSDSLKRCAVMFGVGRELYSHDEVEPSTDNTRKASFGGDVPNRAASTSTGDMATSKQINMIRAIAANMQGDVEAECRRVLGCGVDELTKKSASDFIGHIKSFEEGGNGTLQPIAAEQPEPAAPRPKINW